MEGMCLPEILSHYFEPKDAQLFMDLMVYSIITEGNAAQYYPDYGYNHPLFDSGMHIYSDSKISDFLACITDDQRIGFLNEWNESRDHREKIYISYDSTSKYCQQGDVRFVEYGHAKDDRELPIINYSLAYDVENRTPLFYEEYPGSIVDISQIQLMLEKAQGYGYRQVGFILDRGYFSKGNIEYMDRCGYDFIIMVKGMADLVNSTILKHRGTFENKRECGIRKYGVYGMTVKEKLYISDERGNGKMHHDLDIHPIPKDEEPMFINEPWLADKSYSYMGKWDKEPETEPDNLRIYVPIDLNRKAILRRLDEIIMRYGEANEENEVRFGCEVDMLIYQIEIYDQRWYVRNLAQAKGKHSREAVELVQEFVDRLEEIPDGCAECFPFETIDELRAEFLGLPPVDR